MPDDLPMVRVRYTGLAPRIFQPVPGSGQHFLYQPGEELDIPAREMERWDSAHPGEAHPYFERVTDAAVIAAAAADAPAETTSDAKPRRTVRLGE